MLIISVQKLRIPPLAAILAVTFIGSLSLLNGQESATGKKLTSASRFANGIYLNFSQVKENSPIPESNLLIAADYGDMNFFLKILSVPEIYFTDSGGETGIIRNSTVFGFSADGVLYLRKGKMFVRQILCGAICFFSGDYDQTADHGRLISGEEANYRRQIRKELHKLEYRERLSFILDFSSGKLKRFNAGNLGSILKRDEMIFREYKALSGKARKASMFSFIGKFNEKNPVYLPADR